MKKRWLIAGAVGLGLALVPRPGHAGGLGDILDALTEEFDDLPKAVIQPMIDEIYDMMGMAPRSYLPDGADTYELFPVDPNWPTPGDVKWRVDQGYEDARARVEESMAVASGVSRHGPLTALALQALSKFNLNPENVLEAIQMGNAGTLEVGKTVMQQTQVLAEIGQLMADQHMTKAFASKQTMDYAKYHYRSYSGSTQIYGNGTVNFTPGHFDLAW